MREVIKAMKRLAAKARGAHELAVKAYNKEKSKYEQRKKAAEKANQDFDEDPPEVPVERRYYTDDATYEKLADIVSEIVGGDRLSRRAACAAERSGHQGKRQIAADS